MILYHGSNVIVKQQKLVNQVRFLDFGQGFYTTANKEQAENFAKKVKNNRGGQAILNIYQFDEKINNSSLKIKIFPFPNEEWLDFVSLHRNGIYQGIKYDLIIGPVANDDVYRTLQIYTSGLITKKQALETLKIKKLFNQYVFATKESLDLLKFYEAKEV